MTKFVNYSQELKTIYGIVVLVFQFGVPFTIIAFCYIKIWYFLNHRQSMVTSSGDEQRKRKLLKMLVSMVVIFALCHLALNLLNILRDFEISFISKSRYFTLFFLIAHLLSMSATCWNPILYAGMNENFQREFKAVLPCFTNTNRLNRSYSYTRAATRQRLHNNTLNNCEDTTCNNVGGLSTAGNMAKVHSFNGSPPEWNGTSLNGSLASNGGERKKLLGQRYANGSCYLMGRTENDEEIKFIPDTHVTVV